MASKEADEYHFAVSLSDLKQAGKKRTILKNGRVVVLFYADDQVHALDHFCYRKYINDAEQDIL